VIITCSLVENNAVLGSQSINIFRVKVEFRNTESLTEMTPCCDLGQVTGGLVIEEAKIELI